MPEPNLLRALVMPHKSVGKVTRSLLSYSLGSQRRKKKHVNVQNVNEDKKMMSAIKKFGKPSIIIVSMFILFFRSSASSRY